MTNELMDQSGRQLLKLLVAHFKSVKPGDPRTYISYKRAHDQMGLVQHGATFGQSLQNQGLTSLADWTERNGHPAITGLIIDEGKLTPGSGYFKLFGRQPEDYTWWKEEIEKALKYDWGPYLADPSLSAENIDGEDWSDEELRFAVAAYLKMKRLSREGAPLNKRAVYEELSAAHGRSAKAYEYRMQNISYVLSLMGRDWLVGLKPAQNVGAKNAARIEALILELEKHPMPPVVNFEVMVRKGISKKPISPPNGNATPEAQVGSVTQFKRDYAVKAWVLIQAEGKCECCGEPAPFEGCDGQPFLEVHHVRTLAERGSDTIHNAIAVCPNCHRALHYSAEAKQMVEQLYIRIERLRRE